MTTPQPIKALIFDDHQLMRVGMAATLMVVPACRPWASELG
jgi:hypothetical protein